MNIDSLLEPYIAQIFEAGRQKGIAERAGGSVEKYLNPAAHPRINGKFVKIPEGNTPNWGVPAPGATPVPASASAKPAAPSVPLTASADPMEAVLGAMLLHAVECAQSDQNAVPGLKVLVGLVRDRAQLAKASGVPHATVEKSYWAMVECAWSSEKHPRGKNGRFIAIGRIEQARVDPKVAQQLRREVKPEDRAKLDDAIGGVHEDMPKTVKGQKRIAAHQRRLSKQESRERMEVLKRKLARHGDMKYELTPRDLHEFAELLPGMRVQELRGLRKLFNKNIVSRIGWDGARTQDKMAHRLVGFVHARLATMEGPQPEDKAAAQEPEVEEDTPEGNQESPLDTDSDEKVTSGEDGDTVESPGEPEGEPEPEKGGEEPDYADYKTLKSAVDELPDSIDRAQYQRMWGPFANSPGSANQDVTGDQVFRLQAQLLKKLPSHERTADEQDHLDLAMRPPSAPSYRAPRRGTGVSDEQYRDTEKKAKAAHKADVDAHKERVKEHGQYSSESHQSAIKDALAAGKRIPPEVLADYPDLAGKDAPPAVDAKVNSAKADLPKPAPGVSKGGEFRPEQAIKIAADNIGSLRKPDVFRVLDWAPAEHREKLANYITSNRPELADEVKDVMADVGGSSPVPAQSPSPRVAPEANQSNGDRTEGSTPSTGGHQSASVATPKKWHEAADDYISAVQSGHSIPDAAPEALRDVARRLMNAPSQWHAGIELPNAPTGKSLVDKIGKQEGTGKISREALARTLVDKGWYTDTKHMVKATPQMMEHAKQTGLADAVGRALPVDDIIKSVSGSAQPGELVASKFGDTAGHHVLAKSEDGRTHAVLNGQYVANILKLYPQAKPFVPHGNKAVLFKQDGEVVGLVMPFGGHDEKKAPDINPGKRFSLPDVLEKGPYNPEDATETHNGFQVGSGDDAMTVKVTGNPKAGFNIPDYSDTTYPTRALATKAAKELLAHAHGKDEGGNLVFKPKGQKTELAGPEKQRYELYKELGERVKSHGAKKPVAMKWGEGDDSTSRDVVPITEHFGVSQSVPDANGKGEKSWQLIHTPTGMTVPSGWKKKNDAIGHAILLQNLPDANWSTITDDTIENDKDRLKAIGKRAHALKEAYQDERLHQDMKLHK